MTLLSTTATIAGIGGAVADLLDLGGSSVTLGGFVFSDMEMPDGMPWGVRQRLNRHFLPGGTIKVDAMGDDWQPIAWKGIFQGPGSVARARSLAMLAKAAQPLTLTWLDQTFLVVIRDFSAKDQTAAWVPYRITCEVLADASQIAGPPAAAGLGNQILSDISAALGFNVVDAAGQAATVLGKVQQAADLAGAVTGSAALTNMAGLTAAASGVVGSAIPLAEGALNGLGTVANGAASAANWLTGATTASGNLANATAASGYVGRIGRNLTAAGAPPPT